MVAYLASLQDVYDLGFTAGAFVVRPRALDPEVGDFLDPASGIFVMAGHGYDPGDVLWFVQIAAGSLPAGAGLSLVGAYHPLPIDARRFQIAATPNGTPLTFADAGSGWSLLLDHERRLLRLAENVSRDIDQDLTAHSTPIMPDPTTGRYPDKLVGVVARETARRAVAGLIFENPQFRRAKERIDALQAQDDAQRELWRSGVPINPRPLDRTDEPDNAAFAGQDRAPTLWRTGSL